MLLAVLATLAPPRQAVAGYSCLETEHMRLIYRDVLHSGLAPHVARCFENAMQLYARLFDYVPAEKITVLLDDAYDFNNGAAFAAPRNTILIQIAPASQVLETLPSNERINHTINHEMAHIVALDETGGSDRTFRKLFSGKVAVTQDQPETILYEYLTHPRFAAARWYHEGLASFLETWLAGGIGRAKGAYDGMMFRAMVRDGEKFYDPLGLESEGTKVEFQVGAMSYLYGTRFVTWMAYDASPDSLIDWFVRNDHSRRYYASHFKQRFGMTLDTAWQRWVDWEHGFQQANLDSIRKYPRTDVQDLPLAPLGSVSRAYLDRERGELYAGISYPGVIGHVAAVGLQNGSVRKICDIKGPALYFVTSLAYDGREGKLFFSGDNADWRDLWVADARTGDRKRLMRDARIGDLVFDEQRRVLWGVRHFNGISTLVRIPAPYDQWTQVHSWPYGQDIYDIDVSPDGRRLVFSLSQIDGRQSLHLAELDSIDVMSRRVGRELYDFGSSQPANFVFAPDGQRLFGSSYHTGVSNIWRYDLRDSSMALVSNCETGLFRPLPLGGDSLLVFRYSGAGMVPALMVAQPLQDASAVTFLGQQVAEKYPVVHNWNVGSPARVQLDSIKTHTAPYRAWRSIGLESIYPVVQGYKHYAAVGVRANFSDPGYWNVADVTVSYTPTGELADDERLHASMVFRHLAWKAMARYNAADFYDLFGPTLRSRKGWSVGLQWDHRLLHDKPRILDLAVTTTVHGDLETLPDAQNVAASSSSLWETACSLKYEYVRRSLGAVDEEKGIRLIGQVDNRYASGRSFPRLQGALHLGYPLPLPHSSLWLRTAGGVSPGPEDEPFANFYVGGFGNNWVDCLNEKRYRGAESFPGTELGEVGGTNFVKAMLEWNLPPLRFSRVGTPGLYATWVRPALFTAGIVTHLDGQSPSRRLVDVGGQIDVQFTFLSRLGMTLSFGYATAYESEERRRDEFMVSLKVL